MMGPVIIGGGSGEDAQARADIAALGGRVSAIESVPVATVILGSAIGSVTGLTRDHVIAAADAGDGLAVAALGDDGYLVQDPDNPGSAIPVIAQAATGGTLGAVVDSFNSGIVAAGYRDIFGSMYLTSDGALAISVKDPRATAVALSVAPPFDFCSEIGLFLGSETFRRAEALDAVSDKVSSHGERLLAVESFYGRFLGGIESIDLDAPDTSNGGYSEDITLTFTAAGVSHDVPIFFQGSYTTPRQYMDQLSTVLANLHPGLFGDWSVDERGRLVLPVISTSVTAASFADSNPSYWFAANLGLSIGTFTPASALGDVLAGQKKADAKVSAALAGSAALKTPGFGPYTPGTDFIGYLDVHDGDELHAAFTLLHDGYTPAGGAQGTYTYTVGTANATTFDAFLSDVAAGLNAAAAAIDSTVGTPFSASTEGGPAGPNPPLKLVFSTTGYVIDLTFSGRVAWRLGFDGQVLAPANVYDRLAALEARIAALGG